MGAIQNARKTLHRQVRFQKLLHSHIFDYAYVGFRQDFDAALEYLTMAVNLARSKEELEVLLKERLMANAFKERISIGKLAGIPKAPY